MKKCVFINPYFGKLPKTLPVFLKTCAANSEFDWIFFTDDASEYDFPENVKRIFMTFDEMRQLAQSKFDFKISLERPYKLCDYKPAYGLIFEQYIADYEFWGHCDVDVVLGDLSHFLTKSFMESYDKIFCLGHMILYKNTYDNNRFFMKSVNGQLFYKESFSTGDITWFDETWKNDTSVNTVFLENGKRVFQEDWSLNFKILPTAFTRVKYNYKEKNYEIIHREPTVYLWENGKVKRYYLENKKIKCEEELYMHLQGRKMSYDKRILNQDIFKIRPNRYCVFKGKIDNLFKFYLATINGICLHYFQVKLNRFNKKMKKLFSK